LGEYSLRLLPFSLLLGNGRGKVGMQEGKVEEALTRRAFQGRFMSTTPSLYVKKRQTIFP